MPGLILELVSQYYACNMCLVGMPALNMFDSAYVAIAIVDRRKRGPKAKCFVLHKGVHVFGGGV